MPFGISASYLKNCIGLKFPSTSCRVYACLISIILLRFCVSFTVYFNVKQTNVEADRV